MAGLQQQIEDHVGHISKKLQALKEYTQMVLDNDQKAQTAKLYKDIEDSIKSIEDTLSNNKSNPVILQPTIDKTFSSDAVYASSISDNADYSVSKGKDDTFDSLSSEIQNIISQPFDNSEYNESFSLQMRYWNDFCSANEGQFVKDMDYNDNNPNNNNNNGNDENKDEFKNDVIYKCDRLSSDDASLINKNDLSKWQDYCHLRLSFEEILRSTPQEYSLLLKHVTFKRNQVGLLPRNNKTLILELAKLSKQSDIINRIVINNVSLNIAQKPINNMERYYLIWNAVFALFSEFSFTSSVTDQEDEKKSGDSGSALKTSLKTFLLEQIRATQVFFSKKSGKSEELITNEDDLIYYLFNQKDTCLNWFIDHITQDINDENVYLDEKFSGIQFFIINRLSLLLYDMFVLHRNKEDDQELRQDLTKMYRFIWDFGVYVRCYPKLKGSKRANDNILKKLNKQGVKNASGIGFTKHKSLDESYYLLQFIRWKNEIITIEEHLTKFLYFDGTLLHMAAILDMRSYAELLVTNKFSIFQNDKEGKSCYARADKYSPGMKAFFDFIKFIDDSRFGKSSKYLPELQVSEVESTYLNLKEQKTFANLFLLYLGCDMTDKDEVTGLSHKSIRKFWDRDDIFNDDLYFKLSQFSGIGKTFAKSKEVNKVMMAIVNTVMTLIKDKMPVSDDLMVMSFEYCKLIQYQAKLKQSNSNKFINLLQRDVTTADQFIKLLQDISRECLDNKYKSDTNARDYMWFRNYLLHSNIWLLESEIGSSTKEHTPPLDKEHSKTVESKDDTAISNRSQTGLTGSTNTGGDHASSTISTNTGLLYDYIDETTNDALQRQKKFIFDNIKNEEKEEAKAWDDVINYDEYVSPDITELRQDRIPQGIPSDFTDTELLGVASLIENRNFDIFQEYNVKNYLNKCLLRAHSINPQFHNDMRLLFDEISDGKAHYQEAPIKQEHRAVVKAQTDYGRKSFPSVACVCDFVRCSITLDNCREYLNVINKFAEKVKKKEAGCVIDILRIKNGFKNIPLWNSIDDYRYVDIKFNVLVTDRSGKKKLICEIQFLLKWLLSAKKRGHKLYEIKRLREFVKGVSYMMKDDLNYEDYKNKIGTYIVTNDFEILSKRLLLDENVILSMIDRTSFSRPLLYAVCESNNSKQFELFWSSMMHYQNCLLGPNRPFLSKYLNFNYTNFIVFGKTFWGIDAPTTLKSNDTYQYKVAETIMKSKDYKGLADDVQQCLYAACEYDCYAYLELILKYAKKNAGAIVAGINSQKDVNDQTPLMVLLKSEHCSSDYLKLLLSFNKNLGDANVFLNLKLADRSGKTAIDYLKQRNNPEWEQIINDYAKQTNQTI